MRKLLLIGIPLAMSVVLNIVLIYRYTNVKPDAHVNPADYPYLSPRIMNENRNDVFIGLIPLRDEINRYIEEQGGKISLYFDYLPSNSSIGVNEKNQFPMASLFKLPTVIGIYVLIERDQLSPDTLLTVEERHIDKDYGDFWKRGVGTTISVREAIEITLKESDNTTWQLLLDQLPPTFRKDLLFDLDIPQIEIREGVFYPVSSAKSYSAILRTLYLSSILTKEHSNEILDMLSNTKFHSMLPAGVSEGVKVAHKIGTFEYNADGDGYIYSDCGIVYIPKRPYVLCVMTPAENESVAQQHISHLSKMVYGYVSLINIKETKNGF